MSIINIFKKRNKQLNSYIDIWIVEWERRYGRWNGDTERCYQAFTDKAEAEAFAEDIKRAHKLIGNTSGNYVSVKKQKNML